MIEVPAKIWRPKVINKYTTPHLEDYDVDKLLDYGQYGIFLYKPKLSWRKNTTTGQKLNCPTTNDLSHSFYTLF